MERSTKMADKNDNWGIVAQYDTTAEVYKAAKKLRDAGYKKFETYSPFPIHGMDDAMGIKPTKLPWIVLFCGTMGLLTGIGLSVWSSQWGYNMIISAKPSGVEGIPEFFPIIFELTILFSAFGTVLGMFALNKLPMYYNPVFTWEPFLRASDDKFFISVECSDTNYDEKKTADLLTETGGQDVTVLTK